MANPLAITFDVLATTKAPAAVELLVAALDAPHSTIQDRAVAALLTRGTTPCQIEIIRRLSSLSPVGRKILDEQGMRLSGALRQCLLHGDAELRAQTTTFVTAAECYDQIPTLLQILEQRHGSFHDAACETLHGLVSRLHDHLKPGPGRKPNERHLRNFPQVRQTVLAALDECCSRSAGVSRIQQVIESILVLGDPENAVVRKLLLQSSPECRQTAEGLLLTSKHPGVMRLLMEFMGQNYPANKALETFERRADLEFVCFALETFPKRPSENQTKNFRRLSRIAWITDQLLPLERIPPSLHESLVRFVQSTGLEARHKIEVQEWLLQHGSVPARLAASQVLENLAPESVRGLLFGGLKSEDQDVQAWATSQLRTQGVPEAIGLLIERLDSPLPAVREAARGELGSFNLELMLNIFDHLDRSVCLRAGALVSKIDAKCKQKLLDELHSPICRRRIRAAQAARALGLAREVADGLLALRHDPVTHVRRTAAEVLVALATPEVVAGLAELLNDPSPRVREAAANSLRELHRNGFRLAELDPVTSTPACEVAGD